MANIESLVVDIHHVMNYGPTIDQADFAGVVQGFGSGLALKIGSRLEDKEVRVREPNTLYMSEVGKPCVRQIWYSVHTPEAAEAMPDKTNLKFMIGDLLEDAVLMLAESAGHTVERQQERCSFNVDGYTVRGRIDAVIDGVLVDVKTASKYSFEKFLRGLDNTNDSFGYRAQLNGYNFALNGKDLTRQGFLVIEKTSGDLAYVDCNDRFDVHSRVRNVVRAVSSSHTPKRHFEDIAEGASGNRVLGVECSYCAFKHPCWSDVNGGRGLRTFIYSSGPKYLTVVKKEPKVYEVTG